MKKFTLIALLISMISIQAQAQWFDLEENSERAVLGFNGGILGFRNVTDNHNTDIGTYKDIGFGVCLSLGGLYVDFTYVMPDHRFDSQVIMGNWDDHSAFTLNAGFQIPIYEHYVFITPLVGWSRVSTGYTVSNDIGVDSESNSIYHKYVSTWHRNEFNYGGALTISPISWLDLNFNVTKNAAYAGIAFNLASFQD
ncbi:MAG: hypothetical protein K6F96_03835 [Bacteroidales bacterium]|nr:hypothetical protein [Bacteroidales bacterium]